MLEALCDIHYRQTNKKRDKREKKDEEGLHPALVALLKSKYLGAVCASVMVCLPVPCLLPI